MKYLVSAAASMLLTTVALSSAHGRHRPPFDAAHHGHPMGTWRGHHHAR
ncbi:MULTISPECIES: hypothetical protein [unclassified Sphingomonas]|nr:MULTISPECIES: hypothetical protein [unclassified Sphingomonas]